MNGNYFIIHGSFGNPYNNWIPWVREVLVRSKREVYTPHFPTGVAYQRYESWSRVLKSYVDAELIDENTTIIAHSIAPVFVSRFLIENKVKIKKLISVCGFNNYLGITPEYDEVNETMFTDNIESVERFVDNIICIYSNNDPYVKLSAAKEFASSITTEHVLIPNGGHLNSESGYDTFKEILPYL